MMRFNCPSCGAALSAPEDCAGRRSNCRRCNKPVIVPQPVTICLPSREAPADVTISAHRAAQKAPAASKLPLAFGIASLALSVIGLVFSLIPCIGAWFAVPLCGLGLILGIIGGVFALIRRRHGIGFPLAGSVTGFAGLTIAIMWLTVCSGIFSSANRGLQDAAQRVQEEKGGAVARKREADEVKPVEREKKDAGAAEKRPDVPKLDIQLPPPKPQMKKSSDVVKIRNFLGISPDFKVYAIEERGRSFKISVRIVDFATEEPLAELKWDQGWGHPISVAFGKEFIAAVVGQFQEPSAVRIFSRKTGEQVQHIHDRKYTKAAFTAHGSILALTIDEHHYLSLYNVQGKKTVAEFPIARSSIIRPLPLAISEKYVAVSEQFGDRIYVVEAETGKMVRQLSGKRETFARVPRTFAISPAGDFLAWGQEDNIVLYDLGNEKVIHKLEGHLDIVRAIAFAPNGEVIASTAKDKTIRFWNANQGKEIHVIKELPATPEELIFSANGKKIAVVYSWQQTEIRRRGIEVSGAMICPHFPLET